MRRVGIALVALALVSAGCTTAGPFVTGIGSDGRGGFVVEKCMAHLNAWWGILSTTECHSTSVHLGPPVPAKH